MLTLSESANAKIKELLLEEGEFDKLKLRVFVQGGGCSGFSYGFTFEEEQQTDDTLLEFGSVGILVDPFSVQYLSGSEINYTDDINGSSFVIKNPNAVSTCGCGNSFSPF